MTNVPAARPLPTDPSTGLILPLSKSLGSQDLAAHKAMIAVELEVMAKKMDRFGWERDRGSAAHDRILMDWMEALKDYPLPEVQAACASWVREQPRKMPNEGDILAVIHRGRKERVAKFKASRPPAPEPHREPVSKQAAAEIMAQNGFAPKRFGG
jgi:hypothetical protein